MEKKIVGDFLKFIIVDDDKEAGLNLQEVLYQIGENLDVVGIARDTQEAITLIQRHNPDALFLDIEMPNEDAFHFLERIFPFDFEVIFVTAYETYAVKAFKINAIDYILKPLSFEEVVGSIGRLKTKLISKKMLRYEGLEYRELAKQMIHKHQPSKVFFKMQSKTVAVDFADIYYIEARGSYSNVCFRWQDKEHQVIMSYSVSEYEEILPSHCFFRIHKSYLINCDHLLGISNDDNKYAMITGGHTLPIGRRRYPNLISFIKASNSNKK